MGVTKTKALAIFSQAIPTFAIHILFTTSFPHKYINFAHYTAWAKIAFFCLPEVFYDPKYAKMRFRLGLRPDPDGETNDALIDPSVGWGGVPSPYPSHSAPSALATRAPPLKPGAPPLV